jgi:hypothetical protein
MNICESIYKNNTIDSNYLDYFYKLIQAGNNSVKKTKINISKISSLKPLRSRYIPLNIINYINTTKNTIYKVTGIINSKNIEVYFICYNNESINIYRYSSYVFLILYILTINFKNNCSDFLNIQIYLTPYLKINPEHSHIILDKNEVNTGYSNVGCLSQSNVVIYRKEEWTKVLIHELFHNLNLDFALLDITSINKMLQKHFNLSITFNVNECYAEIWGRLLLTFISSYFSSSIRNEFSINFNKLIKKEISFSLMQTIKIQKRIKNMKQYKENTNAFVYYILTSGLMHNHASFINWCFLNNEHFFYFNKTSNNAYNYTQLILTSLKNENYKLLIRCLSNKKQTRCLRMTLKDFNP